MLQVTLRGSTTVHNGLAHAVDEIVRWKQPPEFVRMGRTAWLPLETPGQVEIEGAVHEFHSVKIKGIGLRDHLGRLQPPSTIPYHRIHPHLGFTPDGKIIPILSDSSPLGGIVLAKARAEFEIARRLAMNGCPAAVPLLLYEIDQPGIAFSNGGPALPAPLGVVVCGLPERSCYRFDAALRGTTATSDELLVVGRWGESLGTRNGDLLAGITNGYGKSLRRFHEAGFYRYSGQPDNYSVSAQSRKVFLLDLDTSRELSECSDIEAPLQLMRDVTSGLYGIIAYVLRKGIIEHYSPCELRSSLMLRSLLSGYFADVSGELLDWAAEKLDKHYSRIHPLARELHRSAAAVSAALSVPDDFQEFRRRTIRQYWIDRDETLCVCLAVVWALYENSALSEVRALPYSRPRLLERIAEYSTPATSAYVAALLGRT